MEKSGQTYLYQNKYVILHFETNNNYGANTYKI